MRLVYIANARMPTEWAHGVQIARMCDAFAEQGVDLVLVVPAIDSDLDAQVADFYGVADRFELRRLPDLRPLHGKPLGSTVQRVCFATSCAVYVLWTRPDLVYSRDELAAALAALVGPAIYELHKFPSRRLGLFGALVGRASRVVSTNTWKRDQLVERFGLDPARILVCPNAADVHGIRHSPPRPGVRATLGLPAHARLVLYSGHLHDWKGVGTLVEAAAMLDPDTHVLLLGGTDRAIERYRREHQGPRVHVLGRCAPAEVAGWLRAADVLVLPNAPSSHEGRFETSPLKLFEYMASGRAIVASDLPSIREVLDDDSALLVQAGSAQALAEGIKRLLGQPALAARLAERALELVSTRTWSDRARRVLAFARSG